MFVKRFSAVLAAVALGLAVGAHAAPPAPGQWQGAIHNPGQSMPVTLTIASASGGVVQFGAPAQCRLALAFAAERPNGWLYKLDSVIGGRFCDSLHGGEALFEPAGNGTIRAFLTSPHARQQFILNPAPR